MLIKTTEELKAVLGSIQKNLSIETMEAYITNAEILYIIPLVSQDEFDIIQTEYDSGTPTPPYDELITKIQRSLAYYAIRDFVRTNLTTKGDAGYKEVETEDLTQARQWVTYNELNHYTNYADTFADAFLVFMEQNKATFTAWANSEAYTKTVELTINNAQQLSNIIDINNSRRAYIKLRTFIRMCEEKYLEAVMGKEQLQALQTKFQDDGFDSFTENQKTAWDYMQKTVAYFSVFEASTNLTLKTRDDGAMVIPSIEDGNRKDLELSREKSYDLAQKHSKNGQTYRGKLESFLNDNPDSFPEYQNSVHYTAPLTENEVKNLRIDNDYRRGTFSI